MSSLGQGMRGAYAASAPSKLHFQKENFYEGTSNGVIIMANNVLVAINGIAALESWSSHN